MNTDMETDMNCSSSRQEAAWGPRQGVGRRPSAFTLIELLVIVSVLALWTCLLTPALTHTRPNSQALQCSNNLRQLATACQMYAADNNGTLVLNPGGSPPLPTPDGFYQNWVTGWLDWASGSVFPQVAGSNTNLAYLLQTPLGVYTANDPSIYKCPADKMPGNNGPRVRSYSMNGFVGGRFMTAPTGVAGSGIYPFYRSYVKEADITVPGPSKLWVIVGEHPDSINDGFFLMRMPSVLSWPRATTWCDVPASAHNGACGISFADGHVEIHKWQDATTKVPVLKLNPCSAYGRTSVNDSAWLVARTSAPR